MSDASHDHASLNGHIPDTDQSFHMRHQASHLVQPGHPDIEADLAAYAANELTPAERADVARHLAGCAACQATLVETQRIRALLRSLATPAVHPVAAASVASGVLARLARTEGAPDRRASVAMGDDVPVNAHSHAWRNTTGPEQTVPAAPVPRMHRPVYVRRGALIPALAATAAIVLVSALLFGIFGAHLRPKPPVAQPTPRPSGPVLPPYSTIMDMTMLSASDGWAVGSVAEGPSTRTRLGPLNALILHYTGGQWQPVSDTFPDVWLQSVSMYRSDDGWAVGRTMHDPLRGVVLHYSGGHWREVPVPSSLLPTIPPAVAQRMHISSFSPRQVLAVGPGDAFIMDSTAGLILHDRQGAWSVVETVPYGLMEIAMVSDDEGWATTVSGQIYHLRAGKWTTELDLGSSTIISSLHMVSASEGWAVANDSGTTYPPPGLPHPGLSTLWLLRYHDGAWTKSMVPRQLYGAYGAGLSSLASQPSGDGWLGGDITDQQPGLGTAFLLRYQGGQFAPVALPARMDTVGNIVMPTADDGWALGDEGGSQVLLRYHYGVWSVAGQNWGNFDDTVPVNQSRATGWQRYTDPSYGFSLEVPASYVTGGPTLIAQYHDQDPYMMLVFQGPYSSGEQIWVNIYSNPDVDVNPGVCQYLGSGTPITVGAGIAGHQVDRTQATPAPGIPGSVPAVEARFLSGGLYVDIQLSGPGPVSTFMAREGATWQHVLASFTLGAAHPATHACGS